MAAGDIVVIEESIHFKKGNYFDGTDDYVLHDAHAVARVAGNDTTGTYTAWIYVNDTSNTYAILSAGDDNSANEYLLWTCAEGKNKIKLQQGGATQFLVNETVGTIPARTWTHVAIVQDGTAPALYVNGEVCTITNVTATDLTMWYDELANCDKFAIGVLESNNTHTADWKGAIGQVKYWNKALTAEEIKKDYNGDALDDDGTYLQFNVTMEDNGTTDSGLGADNGTLTGHAHYGGEISDWSYKLEANSSGHAAEFINSVPIGQGRMLSVIKKGD